MSNPLLILVQARMNSSRFPGKIMKEVLGIPLLVHQLNRIARIKTVAKIVVITSDQPSDDIIESTSIKYGYEVFRGSLLDLLDRHYQAAVFYQASTIVKIPSDCPLIDTAVIDRVLNYYFKNEQSFDYVSNLHPASYPDGNDVEIMSFKALERAWKEAVRPLEREHTTPYFWENPDLFSVGNVVWETGFTYDMSHRFTLDYPEDYAFINQVYEKLYPINPRFTLKDILDLLVFEPEIFQINQSLAGVNWYRNHLDELKTILPSQTNLLS